MFKSLDFIASVVGIFMYLTISKIKQVLRSWKGLVYNTGSESPTKVYYFYIIIPIPPVNQMALIKPIWTHLSMTIVTNRCRSNPFFVILVRDRDFHVFGGEGGGATMAQSG